MHFLLVMFHEPPLIIHITTLLFQEHVGPPLSAIIKSRACLFWRITPAREVVCLWKAAMVEVEVLVNYSVSFRCSIRPESVPGLVSHTRVQQLASSAAILVCGSDQGILSGP